MPIPSSRLDAAALRRRLARRLRWQQAINDPIADPRNQSVTLPRLRAWQAKRLADGFADFLAVPSIRPAAEFFLSDLYADRDFSGRDRDAARLLPMIARVLPPSLLAAACDTIELAVLSHAFDLSMAAALARRRSLQAEISPEDYGVAYRRAGCPRLRRHQVGLILRVGAGLDAAVKKHGVYRLLRAARTPARVAGLAELQGFLERGFGAFEALGGADYFLAEIGRREYEISRRLFAAAADPFGPIQPNSSSR